MICYAKLELEWRFEVFLIWIHLMDCFDSTVKTNNNVADQWDWHMEGGVGNLGIAYTEPS